jgi:excisionase family DNA binding protein
MQMQIIYSNETPSFPMKTPTTYSPKELARFWSCSRKTILRAIESGDLVAIRLGPKTIRVTAVDAAAFYAMRSNLSPSGTPGTHSPPPKRCGRPWNT